MLYCRISFRMNVLHYRSGRYILIKLLRSQHKGENVDVQYVGFRGLAMPHAFEEGSLL